MGVQVLGPISSFLENEPLYGPCSGIGLWQATAALISLLSVVSKGIGKLVSNRVFDHFEQCGFSLFVFSLVSSSFFGM